MMIKQSQYSRLAHITGVINSRLSLRAILETVVIAIAEEIVHCNSVGIYLPQSDGTFRGYVGKPDQIGGVMLDQMVIDPSSDQLASQIIETKQSVYISDTELSTLPDRRPVELFGIKSLLGLPIAFKDELFGLIFAFNSGDGMRLTDAEIQAVEAYVNMAAVAIRNTNLFSQKQLLLDATKKLSLCRTTRETIQTCFRFLEKAIDNPNAAIHLSDGQGGFFPLGLDANSEWTEVQWRDVHKQIKVNFETDLVFQHVIQTKQPLVIPDVYKDSRPNLEACRKFGIHGLFMLPLIAAGELLGVIGIPNLGAPRGYSPAEIQLAESIATAAASTLSDLWRMERLEQTVQARTEELKQNNEKLHSTVAQFQQLTVQNHMILNSVAEGIYGTDLQRQITFCNRAAADMVGYTVQDIIGKREADVFHPSTVQLREFFQMTQNDASKSSCEALLRRDQSAFLVKINRTPIADDGRVIGDVVTLRDITEQMKMELQIRQQGYYDALTGLPNRFHFNERLQAALEEARQHKRQLAVMFIDLDQFKLINDSLGHSSGDRLLMRVAELLSRSMEPGNFVARIGGDEFILLVPDARGRQATAEAAQKIIAELNQPVLINEHEFYVSPSIGIGVFPEDGDDAETLVQCADMAMYSCKGIGGRSFQFYTPTMEKTMNERMDAERKLHNALANQEFTLVYQPQVDLRSGSITGMEALICWVHPEYRLLSPARFIPIVEEMGLIEAVGDWILRTACLQAKQWTKRLQKPIRLSVNLSARQFMKRDFVYTIEQILRDTQFEPAYLELELTESTIFQNTDSVIATTHHLKELGVRLSIDDFGTGYSSLHYLKDLPFDTLKIDRIFISELPFNQKHAAITSAVIALAQNLGLKSVAEGVETQQQMAFLQSQGCAEGQGYYFSRPLSERDATALLETGRGFFVGNGDK